MVSSTKLSKQRRFNCEDEVQAVSYGDYYVKLGTSNRTIFLNEGFTKATSNAMSALLLHYDNQSNEEITVFINSNGGDVDSLSNIKTIMDMVHSPIKTVCFSKAYSAGAVILAAGTKGSRYICEHANVMIHGIIFPIGLPENGHHSDSEQYYKFLEKCNTNLLKILASCTGKPLDRIKQDCSRDFYMTAKEAIAYGMVDHIWRG